MKKNANTKNINIKLATFWSLITLLTLAFVITVIIMSINLRKVDSFSDIKRDNLSLVGDDLFTQGEGEYFVFLYSSSANSENIDPAKLLELEQGIFNYFNFVKHNSNSEGLVRIYGLDVDFISNTSILSNENNYVGVTEFSKLKLNKNDLPALIVVLDGGIDNVRFTTNEILRELQDGMDKVK